MKTLSNNRILNFTLAAGGVLLVTGLCISYLGFLQGFLEYATNTIFRSSIATSNYMHIVPLH
jgi:hypothetical protein